VAQALTGSQTAFEQILRRYQRPVISLLIRLTGDAGLAEDLAQEAFVKAFRNLSAFDTRRRLSSWLFRIAHNTGIDALRRARPPMVEIDAIGGTNLLEAPPTADPIERRALGRAIGQALAALRPDQRTAVVLRYEQGLSFDEIGQVLGIPEATARSHVHRARKDLMRKMTAAGWAPEGPVQRSPAGSRKPE
jgi:RNA polymerase sigma-70 factor (ECF subfamily)